MEKCFICYDNLDNNTIYLPMTDEYFGEVLSIFKNTIIIKSIDKWNFAYYCICDICIDNYLKFYKKKFKYLRNREIGI